MSSGKRRPFCLGLNVLMLKQYVGKGHHTMKPLFATGQHQISQHHKTLTLKQLGIFFNIISFCNFVRCECNILYETGPKQ